MKQFTPTVWLFFHPLESFLFTAPDEEGTKYTVTERVGTHSCNLHVRVCRHYRMYHVFYIKTHLFCCCMKHAVSRGLIEA